MRNRWAARTARALVVAVTAGLLAAGPSYGVAGPPYEAGSRGHGSLSLGVIQLNIYGHVGNADSEEEVRWVVDNVADLVRERRPAMVSLNEVMYEATVRLQRR